MSDRSPLVLCSIVTWNHASLIAATIESLLKQSYSNLKIVVFDNNSTDGTDRVLNGFASNEMVEIIYNKSNVGFCGGHNYVIENFSFNFILLVNPDATLKENYIANAVRSFEKNERIGAVCGLLVQSNDANPVIDSTGMQIDKARRFSLINHGRTLNEAKLESGFVAGLDGALPMFKAEAVKEALLNGEFFNPLFFSHKEDWDISWRLLLLDWKTYFNKECVAVHPRAFKPNRLIDRIRIESNTKFHAFKNQFLLLAINEDSSNFFKDSIRIVSRIIVATAFCIFFERKSLKAYSFLLSRRKDILKYRNIVQSRRQVSPAAFRKLLR